MVSAAELQTLSTHVLIALGAPEDIAAHVAAHLVGANLSGHDSHGVLRIPQYAAMINQGTIRPAARPLVLAERDATTLVDAQRGFGQFSTSFALEITQRKSRERGLAAAAVRQSNHIGRVGHYAEDAAAQGLVALLTVGAAGPGVGGATPFGGAARFLGTNPWTVGIPGQEPDPVLVDFATTVVAEGKLRVLRAKGEPVPPGCIVDKDGRPTTDVEDFYTGGMLLPVGGATSGHKGYGLALASALLGSLAAIGEGVPSVAGAAGEPPAGTAPLRTGGVFMVVIDPGAFGDAGEYQALVQRIAEAARVVRPARGSGGVQVPGDPEARARTLRTRDGIHLPEDTWRALTAIAHEHGVRPPPRQADVGSGRRAARGSAGTPAR